MADNKQLELVKRELGFIGRQIQRIEGSNSDDFETVDAIADAVNVALTALLAYELDRQPELIAA
jgi:hypothetical protein